MARTNGKTQFEDQQIDAEHELPTGEGTDRDEEEQSAVSVAPHEHVPEIEKLRAERDALVDRLARMQAEFDNARKRAAKEQQEYRDYALLDTVKSLIPVLDSFDRALRSSPEKSEFHAGVELIHKQLQDALAKIGVRPISAVGEQFDPRYHEAIEMVDTNSAKDHEVIEELQRGYKLKERLLRPAMVKVARNPKH
ncbi:MAG TPA: nucleotide exchange factor GrpE [Terriglobales bacterium]|nr:nucleotide exchange factor GrpE [Terriglobales bacterium]